MSQNEGIARPDRSGPPQKIKLFFKILVNVIWWSIIAALLIVLFFLAQSRVTGAPPGIGGHQMYIVLSGSMSPTFEARSLILVKPVEPEEIEIGDIITYRSLGNVRTLTTHRVVEVETKEGQLQFVTRGDANDVDDPVPVPADHLIGQVTKSIPYLGAVMSFAQTRNGMLLLILVPGVLLITSEVYKLLVKINRKNDNETDEENNPEG